MKVCTKCQIELRSHRNGVVAVAMALFGPSEVYAADEWYCPICKWAGILGFSSEPYLRHFDPDFEEKFRKIEESNQVVLRFWLNDIEKNQYKMERAGVNNED